MKNFLSKFFSKAKSSAKVAKPEAAPAPVVMRNPLPLPGNLLPRLNALRARYKMVGVSTGLGQIVGAINVLLLAQAVSDWWFDLPWVARAIFLLADLAVLGVIYQRHLDTPLRRRMGVAEAALLVEKKWPQLKQSVIGAVQLAEGSPYSTRGSSQLVDAMLEQARDRTAQLNFNDVIPTRALRRWLMLGGTAALSAVAIAAWAWPSSLALVERIFLLNVPLPTKTIVVPITRDLVIPIGSDVEISAMAQGIIPTNGRVVVTYAQGAPQQFPVNIDPEKPATFSFTMHNIQSAFKYSFYLNDGHGPEFAVGAKVPPSVTGLACEEDFPAYTSAAPRKLEPTELSLLVGSHLHVTGTATDALKGAKVVLAGVEGTVDVTLSEGGTKLDADIPIPGKDLTGFSIHLVDQSGVSSANETVYPITLVPDNPPVVKVTLPADDQETITMRAKPVIAFEASDDYGLTKLSICYQLIPPMIAGETDARPPSGVQSIPIPIKLAAQGHDYEYALDVSAQTPAWQEGYTVNYWIEATDNNTATGPGVTKTDHKQFGVISIEAKQAEILERLKANAAEINTLSDTQQKINNEVSETIPRK